MPKRILVPTDFSAASRAALREAVAVAEACSAEL
ncbi:MAG: universal stress protein, partial [Thermoanaerobaculia bacterium]